MKLKRLFFLFSCLFFFISLHNVKASSNLYGNVAQSTIGYSFNAGYYLSNRFGLKLEYAFFTSLQKNMVESITKKILKLSKVDLNMHPMYGVDFSWRPFAGSFRMDIGFRRINYSALVINSLVNNMHGKMIVKMGKGIRPYVGVGADFSLLKYLTLNLDFGFIFQHTWHIDNYSLVDEGITDPIKIKEAMEDLESKKRNTNKHLKKDNRSHWIVFRIGFGVRF